MAKRNGIVAIKALSNKLARSLSENTKLNFLTTIYRRFPLHSIQYDVVRISKYIVSDSLLATILVI